MKRRLLFAEESHLDELRLQPEALFSSLQLDKRLPGSGLDIYEKDNRNVLNISNTLRDIKNE